MKAWERADLVHSAFVKDGPRAYATKHGIVNIAAVEDGGEGCVEVWVGGETVTGESHFRIFNPPTIAGGREDPMRAVAEAIAKHGGAQSMRGKGRR